MVYWADRKTYVAVVARDVAVRAYLKKALGDVTDEVTTFPDDSALLPELDRLAAAERRDAARYRKILVVQGDLAEANQGMSTAYWARPLFDTVVVLGSRSRHWREAIRTCGADACLHRTRIADLPGRLVGQPAMA